MIVFIADSSIADTGAEPHVTLKSGMAPPDTTDLVAVPVETVEARRNGGRYRRESGPDLHGLCGQVPLVERKQKIDGPQQSIIITVVSAKTLPSASLATRLARRW
jgi:hypothetical protein